MVYRRINRRIVSVMEHEGIDAQNNWEDSLEKDSKPKFRFPLFFSEEKFDNIKLEFPVPEIREPEKPRNMNKVKTIQLGKKGKGGLF
jgi:hypothetical protein